MKPVIKGSHVAEIDLRLTIDIVHLHSFQGSLHSHKLYAQMLGFYKIGISCHYTSWLPLSVVQKNNYIIMEMHLGLLSNAQDVEEPAETRPIQRSGENP